MAHGVERKTIESSNYIPKTPMAHGAERKTKEPSNYIPEPRRAQSAERMAQVILKNFGNL